jgi:hypothetical protein
LLSVSPHDRRRRLQPNPDRAALVGVGALGGDARDEIVGGGLVKLSSIDRDGGLMMARVTPLRSHGSIARLLPPGRSEASIERPGGVEG